MANFCMARGVLRRRGVFEVGGVQNTELVQWQFCLIVGIVIELIPDLLNCDEG